jgi:hypothetical protein
LVVCGPDADSECNRVSHIEVGGKPAINLQRNGPANQI